jgi:DNA-binding GntR family transcriptional regulator
LVRLEDNAQIASVSVSANVIKRSNLVDQIHDELHKRITDRQLVAGERIVIDKLAEEFGVSLIPVREALARLGVERLVTHVSNKGYRVAPAPEPVEMRQLFEARLVLEVGALELGFTNITPAVVNEMQAINDRIRAGTYGPKFDHFRDFIVLNADFHRLLVGLSRNTFIEDAYARLGYHQRVAQTLYGRGPDNHDMVVDEHNTIIDALRRREIEPAKALLRSHILHGMQPYIA